MLVGIQGRWSGFDRWTVAAQLRCIPSLRQAADRCARGTGAGRAGVGRRQERRPGRGPGLRAVSGASRLDDVEKV